MLRVWQQVKGLVDAGVVARLRVEAGDARSSEQNEKMWAMLADVARQVEWYGQWLTAEEWKHVFSAALEKQRVVPALEGGGFVVLGVSTRRQSKRWFSDMFELMYAFGSERNVRWSAPAWMAEASR
ncbi:recombination protein NinB [Chitinimonas arctica]|uniref:Recombination protein NinB n=2 Tax=Chitinimonas arctica TaxID=2594795 RepID=A0A516SMM9_9NEIS|nr:recombination protein NinB [Chitinimonas arctica]